MSKDYCSYHQTRLAIWNCADCGRDFCDQCVIATHRDPIGPPRCALCVRPLTYLGAGNTAKPFWSVAHQFLFFPFGTSGLAMMLLAGGLSLVMPWGLLGLFVLIFTVAVGVKYCFSVLEAVAVGATQAPSVGDAIAHDEDHLFLKLCIVLIAIGFMQAVAEVLVSPTVGTITSVVFTVITPAIIILLAVTKEIGTALSPTRIASLVASIGWPYLLAVFLTNAISTGPYLVVTYASESLLTSVLGLPIFTASIAYFAIVNFAMLGYLLYEHQGDLGYVAGNPDELRLLDSPENLRRQLLGTVNVLAKEGRQTDALRNLQERASEFQGDLMFHQRCFDFARECQDGVALPKVAEPYLELLMSRDAVDQALDIWRNAVRLAPSYRPENAATAHALAERAHSKNLQPEALSLLVNLHKRAPDYEHLDSAYTLAAQIFREGGDAEKVEQLEAFLTAFLERRRQAAPGNLALRSAR